MKHEESLSVKRPKAILNNKKHKGGKEKMQNPFTNAAFIALFTIIRTDRNMLLACYSHKHISYRIRTIIRKAIV
ncbi:hypothetical protein [Wolbachia endosymbiont (group A) of Scambus nigricans]|uniref:hypothetical protein n=1 Tax=Wolbachia endosymbiont (group A) of Scambus nigricans TaxID=2954055 RepID=UPI00222F4BF9|nr:hypothetical protein [Wolbachia endosymbiont (group A) of Scambus nigricans]